MENEKDTILITDDEGNEIECVMLDYFEYEDNEYAVLTEAAAMEHEHHHEDGEECDHDHSLEIMIMKFEEEDGEEILVSVEEDKMDALVEIAEERLQALMSEEDSEE